MGKRIWKIVEVKKYLFKTYLSVYHAKEIKESGDEGLRCLEKIK